MRHETYINVHALSIELVVATFPPQPSFNSNLQGTICTHSHSPPARHPMRQNTPSSKQPLCMQPSFSSTQNIGLPNDSSVPIRANYMVHTLAPSVHIYADRVEYDNLAY